MAELVKILVICGPGHGFGYGSGHHIVSSVVAEQMVSAGCATLVEKDPSVSYADAGTVPKKKKRPKKK